jgi:hypothetical protein
MRNRQFEFSPKTQYARAASPCEAASSPLQFPVWCRILELVRTSFRAAEGGAENPPQEMQTAKPHRSKTAKEPGKTSARTIFKFGKKKILGMQFIY